jgi:N,N'-diacetyllegionaminate synthase
MKSAKVTIIAEIGSVHDGSLGNALKAVEVCRGCGADIVKFQTHIPEAETLRDAPMPLYFKGEPRFEYFQRTAFSPEQWGEIRTHCKRLGIGFLSSPFSMEAVDLLEEVGVSSYKIPSGEVNNIPLLERVSETGKAVYLSSGMSNWAELDLAVETLGGSSELTILQCSSMYPCPPEQVGLNAMLTMAERYNLPVGLSDHTLGLAASISAVALGATVIEKHFTFSKLMYGSDAKHSLEPNQFKIFCEYLRETACIIANPVDKDDLTNYKEMKCVFEKSIVTARRIEAGSKIKLSDLNFKKPGDGIPAAKYRELVGRYTVVDLPADHKIIWEDLA